MARIKLPPGNGDETIRALGLSESFAKAIAGYSGAIYGEIALSMREREAARMRVAQINQCPICLGYRFPELEAEGVTEAFYAAVENWRDSELFSAREKLIIEYTERYMTDHLNIDDDFFKQLHEHFDSKEIFELTSIISGLMANGRLLQVLKIDQQCTLSFDEQDTIN